MTSWGATGFCVDEGCSQTLDFPVGPDAREGNQPRGSEVRGNLAHDVGIFQKQSSMWFQAKTASTLFTENVFFNGPRAALNFNDQVSLFHTHSSPSIIPFFLPSFRFSPLRNLTSLYALILRMPQPTLVYFVPICFASLSSFPLPRLTVPFTTLRYPSCYVVLDGGVETRYRGISSRTA